MAPPHNVHSTAIVHPAARLGPGVVVGPYAIIGAQVTLGTAFLIDQLMKSLFDVVNERIKFREPFRPFAPSVLAEAVPRYYDLPEGAQLPARFMLAVPPVKPERRHEIPAVTHVDGTGRLQVVDDSANWKFAELLRRFAQATGVPVLLNTSFNLKGEPIVNTPKEAYMTFARSGLDALVIEDCIVLKEAP